MGWMRPDGELGSGTEAFRTTPDDRDGRLRAASVRSPGGGGRRRRARSGGRFSAPCPPPPADVHDELDERQRALEREIGDAEREGDEERLERARAEMQALDRRRVRLVRRDRRRRAKGLARSRRLLGGNPLEPEGDDGGVAPVDFSRDPGSPQRLVPYERLFRDGIMDLGDGSWSLSVAFDDTNYLLAREDAKEDVNRAYQDWLNSHDEDEGFQLTLISKRVDKRAFEETYALPDVAGDEVGNAYRRELNAYVSDRLTAASASMRHERVMTFTCRADDHDGAVRRFAAARKRFARFVRKFKCGYRVLGGQARMDLLNSITKPDEPRGKYTFGEMGTHPGLTTRDLVCPWRVWRPEGDRDDSRLVVGGRWVRSWTLLPTDGGWGPSMRDSLLSDLSSIAHDLVVSVHVAPWSPARAARAATTQHLDIADENTAYRISHSRPDRGYFIDESNMPRKMAEAEEGALRTRDELVGHRQRLFGTTVVVTAFARSAEELEDASHDVEEVFQTHQKPGLESWVSLREQSYTTMLPLGTCRVPYAYNLMTDALSMLVPFMSCEFQDEGGTLLGTNADTNNLILYSRTAREHTNAMVLGQPRGGKSVMTKLMMLQTYLTDPESDQIILDPEGEYVAGVARLGQQVVKISESSADHVNPLDISPYYASTEPTLETNPIPAKVSFVQELISMMSHEITDEERNALDVACQHVYEPWLESRDDEDIPTLGDLSRWLAAVDGHRAAASHHLAELLYRFTDGTFDFFNHRTNVDVSSRLVDFSLVDMSRELKPLAMLVLLDQIWVRVTRNRREGRRTWLLVDEMQILIDDPHALHTLDIFWTRARKWDLYNTAITQNVSRLEDSAETSYMLQNSAFVVLVKQSPDAASSLAEGFGLSGDQRDILSSTHPGEGIALIDTQPVHFDLEVDRESYPALYRFVTTSPDDLRAERRHVLSIGNAGRGAGEGGPDEGGAPSGPSSPFALPARPSPVGDVGGLGVQIDPSWWDSHPGPGDWA